MKETLSKILSAVAKIAALLLILALLLYYIDGQFHFLPATVVTVLTFIKNFGGWILVSVVAVAAVVKRSLVLTIIVLVLIAAVFIFMCLPENVTSWIQKAKDATSAIA